MWNAQWSTSYKYNEEVHYGAVGLKTISDRIPIIAPVHIIRLAQMQWAASVTVSGSLLERARKCMTIGIIGLGMRTEKGGTQGYGVSSSIPRTVGTPTKGVVFQMWWSF